MAEWLGRGLQNLVQQFKSATDLHASGLSIIWIDNPLSFFRLSHRQGQTSRFVGIFVSRLPTLIRRYGLSVRIHLPIEYTAVIQLDCDHRRSKIISWLSKKFHGLTALSVDRCRQKAGRKYPIDFRPAFFRIVKTVVTNVLLEVLQHRLILRRTPINADGISAPFISGL